MPGRDITVRILASTSVRFGPTTVQMPNLSQTETTRITVHGRAQTRIEKKYLKNALFKAYKRVCLMRWI